MASKLSIIIPCYNSKKTLKETLASVYTQNLTAPFEVVMVDDGSIDGTRDLIVHLAKEHKEVTFVFHDKNKGGGAARNTGIKNSVGNLIFCLDSDNFFPPNMLQGMIDYLNKKQCDGVAINERRFFLGNNTKKYESHFNIITNENVTIDNLFDNSNTLPDNFLFTRESYNRTGGYPENHGFDTQCFEVRYLSAGNVLYVCPGSIFYHRQDPGRNSYFQRVYKNGEFSVNTYLVYEDIIHLFSKDVRKQMMEFDIFKNSKFGNNDLRLLISGLYLQDKEKFYIKNKEKYMHPDGFRLFYEDFKEELNTEDLFVCSVYLRKNKEYSKSFDIIKQLLVGGFESPILYYGLLRNSMAIAGNIDELKIESNVINVARSLIPVEQKISSIPPVVLYWLNKFPNLKKIIKKISNL